ncbi:uroporphyrinogen-III synthase [Candidatus Hecatella orcuttiae]|jgi:uroporphyrinogen-III synthase|uniref:uroporphyrinogen-III synthase n=1 Tax=Candidatus Hecatella orcuttiae TaxID=1935119 RepID=UPI002867E494|nr:uroporphyrinogen-III synthase [Candidatus Hecatella orcuttiae]
MALRGKTIAVTRPEEQARGISKLIRKEGGCVYLAPTVEIKPPKSLRRAEALIKALVQRKIDYLIFMSVNGVRGLFGISKILGLERELRKALGRTQIAAIGPKTRSELEKRGVRVKLVPAPYSSEGLIQAFRNLSLKGKTVAIARTEDADSYLREGMKGLGAKVVEVPVYRSTLPSDRSRMLQLARDLSAARVDAVTFTSSSTVENLFKVAAKAGLAGKLKKALESSVTVLAIGSKTRETLRKLGVASSLMPEKFTAEAMLKAYIDFLKGSSLPLFPASGRRQVSPSSNRFKGSVPPHREREG